MRPAEDNETLDNGTIRLHTDTIAVMAENKTQLDTKLRGKWNGMKAGFTAPNGPNIEGSLKYISMLSNEKYREIFTAISAQLPSIAADMNDIQMIYAKGNIAKYRIRRDDTINGSTVTITYYIYFIKDMNGIWKIDKW